MTRIKDLNTKQIEKKDCLRLINLYPYFLKNTKPLPKWAKEYKLIIQASDETDYQTTIAELIEFIKKEIPNITDIQKQKKKIETRINALTKISEQLLAKYNVTLGSIADCNYWLKELEKEEKLLLTNKKSNSKKEKKMKVESKYKNPDKFIEQLKKEAKRAWQIASENFNLFDKERGKKLFSYADNTFYEFNITGRNFGDLKVRQKVKLIGIVEEVSEKVKCFANGKDESTLKLKIAEVRYNDE